MAYQTCGRVVLGGASHDSRAYLICNVSDVKPLFQGHVLLSTGWTKPGHFNLHDMQQHRTFIIVST